MSLGIFLAVLGAAFLHALWNALIKLGTSKVGGMVILSIVEVPIGLMVVMLTPAIDRAAVPWVIAEPTPTKTRALIRPMIVLDQDANSAPTAKINAPIT